MRRTLRITLLALACSTPAAWATDLLHVWQAAQQNDRELAVARAAQATAQPRRDQAAALWRPGVAFTATAGLATGESEMRGAQFSAPGLGTSSGVNFGTSVTGGTATRWALQASQPLYNPQRRAQQQQLGLQADMADLEWQAAQQALMLRTAQRYFDVAVAQEALGVLDLQLQAVQKAATEAQDRFDIGSAPVTDTYEARARLAALRAQRLAAQTDLDVKRRALAEKHRRSASATVDLVAQAGQERLHGSGDYGSARNKNVNALVGVQLNVPLTTGGYRSAKEEEALRLLDKAQAQVQSTREQVAQQVHGAWLGLSLGAERVQALAEALSASEARRDATQTGHEVGHRTLLDRLNAENDTAAARLALAQARAGLLLDRLRLAQLAGRLDEDTLRATNQALSAAP